MILRKLTALKRTGKKPLSLDYRNLPVLDGESLFLHLSLHTRIRAIRRKVGIDPQRFDAMYIVPIQRFCELVQLIPASQAYHHAFPGGLIVHTLTVVEYAIQERRKHTLPLASEPEIIEAQKNLWTFAVFVAALLHDMGKAVTMVNYINLKNERALSPLAGTLSAQGVNNYTITFKPSRYYSLHERLGIAFLYHVFDSLCLDFLTQNLDVFSEVLGYIGNDAQSWGSIGEIVRTADSLSTAEDLRINPELKGSRKFFGANLENFGERVMRTIRLLIQDRLLGVNRPGAALFISSDRRYVYAVSKVLADRVREKMQALGASDIPQNNTRIFDELQQQGFAESTDKNEAIFRVRVSLPETGFDQTFTCLKFQCNKLLTINNMPTAKVHISELKNDGKHDHNAQRTPVKRTENIPHSSADGVNEGAIEVSKQDTGAVSAHVAEEERKMPETVQEIRDSFFDWLLGQIDQKKIIVNRSGQPVYAMDHGGTAVIGLVSPKIFAEYSVASKLFENNSPLDRQTMIQAASIVQSALHRTKTNIPNGTRQIHYYQLTSSAGAKPKLSLYLVPLEQLPEQLQLRLKSIGHTDLLKRT